MRAGVSRTQLQLHKQMRAYGEKEALYSVIQVYVCRDGRVWRSGGRRARCSWDGQDGQSFLWGFPSATRDRAWYLEYLGILATGTDFRDQRRLKVCNSGSGMARMG